MIHRFLFVILSLLPLVFYGQVGIGTSSPDPSAALEIRATSNDKGLLIPRLTLSQRNAISGSVSPANGLLIFQTDSTPGFYYYSTVSTSWELLGTSSGGTDDQNVSGSSFDSTSSSLTIAIERGTSETISLANLEEVFVGSPPASPSTGYLLYNTGTNKLQVYNGSWVDVASNTDSQTIVATLSGTVLQLLPENTTTTATVDLAALSSTNTDSQTLSASLSGDDLQLLITGGITQTVDLSGYTNTDSQTLTALLVGNNLQLRPENTTTSVTVNLSSLANTDSQTLSISGTTISLTDGGSVNLPPGFINTDSQTLSIAGQVISLTGGGAVTVPSNTDSQSLSLTGNTLALNAGGSVDLSSYSNTDSQTLSLSGQVLTISAGNSVTLADTNTDSQTIAANLNGTDLRLQITGSTTQTVPLASLANTDSQTLSLSGQVLTISAGNSVTLADTNTDSQTIAANLNGTDLRLQITGSTTQTVPLASLANTDSQTLSLSGQVLTISAGNSVTLADTNTDTQTIAANLNGTDLRLQITGSTTQTVPLASLANTDSQTLSLSGQVLTISAGNSVTLADTNTDTQTIAANLNGTDLRLQITGSTTQTVPLASLANTDSQTLSLSGQVLTISAGNSVTLADTNTDTQTIAANLNGTDLRLQITGSTTQTVPLASLANTDSQTLSLSGQVLTISAGNSVTLADTNTDTQTINAALAGTTLQLRPENTTTSATVDMSSFTNTDTQTLAQVTAQGTITTDSIQVAGLTVSGTTGLTVGKATNQYLFPVTRGTAGQVLTVSSTSTGTLVFQSITGTLTPVYKDEPKDNIVIMQIPPSINTSAIHNTGVGYEVLNDLTSGRYNVAFGNLAIKSLTTGAQNLSLGHFSMRDLTTGNYNTAVGDDAFFELKSYSNRNTALGNDAGYELMYGNDNVLIGNEAGEELLGTSGNPSDRNTFVGAFSGPNNLSSSADENVGLGYRAGYYLDDGDNNIYIGANAGPTSTTDEDNKMYIGNNDIEDATLFSDSVELTGTLSINTKQSTSTLTFPSTQGSAGQVLTVSSTTSALYFANATTNTDSQTISGSLTGNTLNLWNQGTTSSATVDLSAIANTDTQTLSISGQVISLTGGGFVTVPSNTDSQTINAALAGTTLQLRPENTTTSATVDLSSFTNTDTQTLAQVTAQGTITTDSIQVAGLTVSGTTGLTVGEAGDQFIFPTTQGTAGQVLTVSTTTGELVFADKTTNTDTQTLAQVTAQGTITTDSIQVAGLTVSGTTGLTVGKATNQYLFPVTRGTAGQVLTVSSTSTGTLVFQSVTGTITPVYKDESKLNVIIMSDPSTSILGGADDNTALGFEALDNITSGSWNTAIGAETLDNLTTGFANVGIGFRSLWTVTTSYHNTAVGFSTLNNLSTSGTQIRNTALGYNAGNILSIGDENVFIGADSGDLSYTANKNTFIGTESGPNNGSTLRTGDENVSLGYRAGYFLGDGDNNIYIGSNAGPTSSTNEDNQMYIGNSDIEDTTLFSDSVELTGTLSINTELSANTLTFPSTQGSAGQVLTVSTTTSALYFANSTTNTDSQTIAANLNGTDLRLQITGSTTQTVPLASLANTDSQTLSLSGQVLTISAGNSVTLADTNTDTQTIAANLNGTDLRLQITGSTTQTVPLASLANTDSQTLSLSGQVLTISAGNSVTLADTNTDSQTINAALAGTTLQLRPENTTTSATVDLSSFTNTDTQTLAQVTAQGSQTTDTIRVGGIIDLGVLLVAGDAGFQSNVTLGDDPSNTISFLGEVDTSIYFNNDTSEIGDATNAVSTIFTQNVKSSTSNDLYLDTNDTGDQVVFANNGIARAGVNSTTFYVGDYGSLDYYLFPTTRGSAGQVLTVSTTTSELVFSSPDTLPTGTEEGTVLRWDGSDWVETTDLRIAPGSGYNPSTAIWTNQSLIPSPTNLTLGQSGNGFSKTYTNYVISSVKSVTFSTSNGTNNAYLKFEGDTYGNLILNEKTSAGLGERNTVFGIRTLNNSGGVDDDNVAVGYDVMNGSSGTGSKNVGMGRSAMSINEGDENVGIGYNSLYSNTTGTQNVSLGSNALEDNTIGSRNNAVGYQALNSNTNGEDNIAIGKNAMDTNTTGDDNIAIGSDADVDSNNLENAIVIGSGATVTTSNTIRLGNNSLTTMITSATLQLDEVTYPNTAGTSGQVLTVSSTTGYLYFANASGGGLSPVLQEDNSIYIMEDPSATTSTAERNTALGYDALESITEGDDNVAVGYNSLAELTTGTGNIGIGVNLFEDQTTITDNVAIGKDIGDRLRVGVNNTGNVLIGNGVMNDATKASADNQWNVAIGLNVMKKATTSTNNVVIGTSAMANTSGSGTDSANSVAIGQNALYEVYQGDYNVAVGSSSGRNLSSGDNNTFIGNGSGRNVINGDKNVAVGLQALSYSYGSGNTGDENTAIGANTLSSLNSSSAGGNTAIGQGALSNLYSGNNNTALGKGAGDVGSGNSNIFIGADGATGTYSNRIYIGKTLHTDTYIYGSNSINLLGQLTLNDGSDTYKLPSTRGTAGQVLTVSTTTSELVFADASSGTDTQTLADVTSQGTITTDNIQVGGLTVSGTTGLTIGEGGSQYSLPTQKGIRGQSLVISSTTNQLVFASRYYLLAKNSGMISMADNTAIGGFSVSQNSGITITTSGTTSIFNLPANRVYELTGHINLSSNDEVQYQFHDGSNSLGIIGESGGVIDQDKDGGTLTNPMGFTSPTKAIIDTFSGSKQITLRVDSTSGTSKPRSAGTYVMIKEL